MATDLLLQGRNVKQLAGEGSAWIQSMGVYKKLIELRTVGNVITIYKGWADYGTALDVASWRVVKLVIDQTTELDISETIAGTGDFDQVWDNRASLTYT